VSAGRITLIGTCPVFSSHLGMRDYIGRVAAAAAVAERQKWTSMLVYSDHSKLDPWVAADILLRNSNAISPLVAVQPLYMHPFNLAKLVASLSLVHGRPIDMNFVSGGLPRDLETFCDDCGHDERYERLREYIEILKGLFDRKTPHSFAGKYYKLSAINLPFTGPPNLREPIYTVAGSSSAGLEVARSTNSVAIQYLRPASEYKSRSNIPGMRHGARIGVIVRQSTAEAWAVAHRMYPADPIGVEIRDYFTSISDSIWVKELARDIDVSFGHPYWLGPYRSGRCACPFLVGSLPDVANELAKYMQMGLRTFLLEQPEDDEDAGWVTKAFALAERICSSW